jgi:purine-binding chemotaxis protein CheW
MEKTDLKAAGKCLTFRVGREEYGMEILKVREIVCYQEITAVPMTTSHIRGVINLRGKIIPVVDLRHKLGLPEGVQNRETCIVVAIVQGRQGESLVGLLVDAVNEVFGMGEASLEPIPLLGEGKALDFIQGLAKVRGRVVILLDVDRVVQAEELEGLEELGKITGSLVSEKAVKG